MAAVTGFSVFETAIGVGGIAWGEVQVTHRIPFAAPDGYPSTWPRASVAVVVGWLAT